jgi:hypothetical protein
MGIVEFVDRLVMTVGEDGRLGFVRVHVQALFVMVLGLEELWDIFGHGIEFFLDRTGTTCAMLAAARMWLGFSFSFFMWAIFFGVGFVVTIALDMLRASLAQASAVLALRNWSTLLVDVHQRAILMVT